MKKKILGLGIVAAVVISLVATGTWALFSDTETSTDNTFTAGTIDLVLTQTDHVVRVSAGLDDLKPCETGYLTITLTAETDPLSNPMHVWKHIVDIENVDRGEGALPDAEQDWYAANPTEDPKNDIDRYIHFDMTVNTVEVIPESLGWLLSDNQDDNAGFDPAPIAGAYNGVTCKWIYLGILDPTGDYAASVIEMVIVESFHMDATVDNWAQGDVLTFDEEFYAVQVVGSPTPPGDELPGFLSGLAAP